MQVIVDADSGQLGDFLAPETGHPAHARMRGKACLLRGDTGPAGPQEFPKISLGNVLTHDCQAISSASWARLQP